MEREHIADELIGQLRARPYVTLAGLVAVGWVLGRGVSVRALVALAGLGARAAVATGLEHALRERVRASLNPKERK